MAAKSGDVVYRAGEHSDTSDIWDDTALIEAYDRAISAIKNGGKSSSTKNKAGSKNRKQQSSKKKDKKKAAEQEQYVQTKWHVGDSCRAVYSEDELIYDAIIISLDASSSTCVVRFCGYGNEEEQTLDDLLPPLSKRDAKSPRQNGIYSGWPASPGHQSENKMDWSSGAQSPLRWQVSDLCLAPEHPSQHLHEAVINSFPTPYTCMVTFLRSRQRQEVDVSALKPSGPSRQLRHHHHHSRHHHPYNSDQRHPLSGPPFPNYTFPSNYQTSMSYFPPPPPPPIPPTLPPQHWPMANPTGFQPPATTSTAQFPFAPMPAPPAPVNSSDISHDNDALASMLMAWYLSGYHTGYYQAIQNLRRGTNMETSETPQVSTTETDASKQDAAELPTT